MSDNEKKAEASAPEVFEAHLVRGKSYTVKGRTFTSEKPVIVDVATKKYLEERAFDDVTVGEGEDAEIERRSKFEFRVPGQSAPARKRSRG